MNLTLGAYLGKVKTNRAAVLPYTLKEVNGEKKLYFLVAIDSKSGDITDLGGGVKKYECSLTAAMREFREETNEIFGDIYHQINIMSTNIAIIHNKMSVLFIPFDEKWVETTSQIFKNKKSYKKSYNEVSELLWVSEDKFKELLSDKKMWDRVRNFYRAVYNKNISEVLILRYLNNF